LLLSTFYFITDFIIAPYDNAPNSSLAIMVNN